MKERLKMADVFVRTSVEALERHINDGHMSKDAAKYAAHAINSHDELVAEVERLRGALISSRLALSNAAMNMKWFDISKAQEILREVNAIDKLISAIGTSDATI